MKLFFSTKIFSCNKHLWLQVSPELDCTIELHRHDSSQRWRWGRDWDILSMAGVCVIWRIFQLGLFSIAFVTSESEAVAEAQPEKNSTKQNKKLPALSPEA
jgi:hypothetical protein